MRHTNRDRLAELEVVLLSLDDVEDCVVLSRCAVADDGQRVLVAYVAPAAGAVTEAVKLRAAERLAGCDAEAAIVLVRRIPRRFDGAPDLDALRAVPVLTVDAVRAYSETVSSHGVKVELRPVAEDVAMVRVADKDAEVAQTRPTATTTAVSATEAADATDGAPLSYCEGPPLDVRPDDPETVTQAILESAWRYPELGVLSVSRDGDRFIAYPELLERGRKVLGGLRKRGLAAGSYAILAAPTLTEYFPALWACLLGGIVPVTVSCPPSFDATSPILDKLAHAWRALGRPLIITDEDCAAVAPALAALYGEPRAATVMVAELSQSAPSDDIHEARPQDTAILALSSGSTGQSKVIQVTHRAIVENAISARGVDLVRPGEVSFNWLPFDHVAPQVMYLLRDVVLGCVSVHAPTGHIVEQPLRWLDVMERHHVNHTWSANFGYRLVADALRANPERRWDLSRVRTTLNAGEQCTPPVIREFLARVEPYGVNPGAMVHMWGMAETATGATCKFMARPNGVRRILKSSLNGRLREAAPQTPDVDCVELMSMGPAAPGAQLRVTDDDHHVVPEGVIGRFQVKATRVTPGYLENPEANREAFTSDGWFDTGDLAFIMDGEVVITGRSKELIVINGEKYYCHEIEDVCGRLEGVRGGLVAACGTPDAERGSEVLSVFFVPENPGMDDTDVPFETIERIRSAVAARLRLTARHVLPITEAEFPRTSSGKIQRAALVRRMASGEFDALVARVDAARSDLPSVPDCVFVPSWRAGRPRLGPSRSNGVTLVFQSDRGLDHGGQPEQAIVVRPGDGFRRTPDGYLIDPARGTDWEALHADLDRRGIRPATLLYLWSYLGVPADRAAAHDAAVRCGQQLLACVQTFLRPGDEALPELVAVTRQLYRVTGEEQVCYPAALTASIVATLARELPQARVRHIDLPGVSDESDAFTLLQARRDEGAATSAAWRRGRPYLRAITPTADSAAGRDALRRGGRYLVTGGCGGVGGQILTDLADRYSARLLVIGRRPLDADPDLAAAWRRLDAPGRDVRYRAADVVDAGALRAAVDEAEEQWDGPLDGVIHLADSYRLRAITDEEAADWDPDRLAKVGGTLNLLDIVRDRPGARLIVFSSLLGSLAFGNCAAYGAGNAFADALVEHLVAAGYADATSVAWGLWHGIGINADNPYEAASARRGVLSLSPDQGRILARLALRRPGGVYQVGLNAAASETRGMALTACPLELERPVLISDAVTDLPALPPLVDPFGTTAPLSVEDRVAPDGGGCALSPEEDEVLQVIRAILAPLVDQPIELARSIHAYGISSIHMLQIHAQLEDALDLDIPKSALFEHPTIARLVAYLADRV